MDTANKGIKLYPFSPWAVFSNINELLTEIWLTSSPCFKQWKKSTRGFFKLKNNSIFPHEVSSLVQNFLKTLMLWKVEWENFILSGGSHKQLKRGS